MCLELCFGGRSISIDGSIDRWESMDGWKVESIDQSNRIEATWGCLQSYTHRGRAGKLGLIEDVSNGSILPASAVLRSLKFYINSPTTSRRTTAGLY